MPQLAVEGDEAWGVAARHVVGVNGDGRLLLAEGFSA